MVDDAGFDSRREHANVLVDDVRYLDMPAAPVVFAERVLEDGTIRQTKIEEDGENPHKTIEISPFQVAD